MPWTGLQADDQRHLYRFGSWTVVMPPALGASTFGTDAKAPPMGPEGIEILAYWEDGKQRAVALRFDAVEAKKDVVALRSFGRVHRLKGCKFGMGASSIKPLKNYLPKTDGAPPELEPLPEDIDLSFAGTNRSLRRTGDLLVADLGTARIQIADDSPIVRLGEWGSADFCRFELKPLEPGKDDPDDEAPW